MDGPIASAVVLPDDLSVPASPVKGQKRRQDSTSEDTAKRLRQDVDPTATDRRGSSDKDTKPAPVRRERGRERRLFGAVLGTLSQNTATTAQKRRVEIEKKLLAQRRQDDQESEQRKAERTARRKEQRWKEQKRFERASMRTRHENLVSMAHFLQTTTEPRLYYKPWETSPDEEDRIQAQIAEAEATIKREVDEYEACQEPDNPPKRHASEQMNCDAEGSQTGKNHNADATQDALPANAATNGSATSPIDLEMKHQHQQSEHPGTAKLSPEDAQDSKIASRETVADEPSKDDEDENGEDVVEEAAEDTVIY